MEGDQDQIELNPVEEFEPGSKRRFNVFVQDNLDSIEVDDDSENEDEEFLFEARNIHEPNTTWSPNETLALINMVSLHKDKFKDFKIKKNRWQLIARELAKIGIDKLPQKCEIKWRNLLRTYRIYKSCDKSKGKFEFFNELDNVISNDPQFKYICESVSNSSSVGDKRMMKSETTNELKPSVIYPFQLPNAELQYFPETSVKKKKCPACKSEKQKRHDERMLLLRKKLELEERKVKAFEDYINFLKSTHKPDL